MITEMAILTALPGKGEELGKAIGHGVGLIRQHPGCLKATVARCVEKPDRFTVTVEWTSIQAHTEDFRGSPLFGQWLASIKGLFDPQTLDTHHYAAYPA
jgi:quinol monooxygenase YgiN